MISGSDVGRGSRAIGHVTNIMKIFGVDSVDVASGVPAPIRVSERSERS